jgi:hypothetical protein
MVSEPKPGGALLFVGDDWAEDHGDIEIVDTTGQVLHVGDWRRDWGITRLHALIAERMPARWADLETGQVAAVVNVGIESDRGPWVAALIITGYEVFAINPMSAARYRQRHSTSGAKSDTADAHLLAEIVRLDRAHHRPVAGDSHQGEAIKLTAARTRAWSGIAPDTCCGTGRPSTSTSPDHFNQTPTGGSFFLHALPRLTTLPVATRTTTFARTSYRYISRYPRGGLIAPVSRSAVPASELIAVVSRAMTSCSTGSTPGTNGDEEPMTSEFVAMPARHTPHVWEVDGQVRGNVNLHLGSRGGF